ncbi:EamA-like transporter family protein [Microbulbifer donghaiensis]|uniref:EamA-like transporter family protein n=1 Tax=Microbulbifer donghaiensis TaxID=494016 RepID=A0A1M4V4T6_9GAMM|nr:DMT family transporter [Microbulbifer donghaiensis]SHE63955.1 EamA-like transporter family protein [Microbulbifer donghaiensis]
MVVPESIVYGLVLLSALAHAAWNAVVKHSAEGFLQLAMIRSVGLLIGILLATQLPPPEPEAIGFLLGGAIFQYIYFFLLTRSYRVLDYGTAYPLARGVTPLLVALAALLFLDESLQPLQLTGVLLVSCGILALLLKELQVSSPGILLSLGTGIAITGYTTLGAAGVRTVANPLSFVAWLEILSGAGILLAVLVTQPMRGIAFARTNLLRGSASGVLASGGFAVALWATSVMPVAAVAATRETSILFASVISVYVLNERFSARRLIAALIIFTGVGALAFA